MTSCLLAFACGALHEAGCVAWVHHSEGGRAIRAATASLFLATADVTGLLQAFHGGFWPTAAFVVGCATGTGVAVEIKRRMG